MLSIIIPLRNESSNLKSLRDCLINEIKNLNCEIILINDFSNGNTYGTGMKIAEVNSKLKIFNNDQFWPCLPDSFWSVGLSIC